ncbi:MAG: BatA domain-containing protein [Planctomycetes bacterium]|nr:BatA domain-containing protein [Planctomycetota bacterium]
MTFGNLGPGVVFAGLAVLAIGFYLLQRLRVRYRPITVETTLFWKEALEEARARVLVKRFRHPWAYALVLAIAAFLWLALAGPELGAGAPRRHLILIDGSRAMVAEGRFEAAVALAEDASRGLPSAARSVVLCADRPRSLLLPGENPLLLRARLGAFVPTESRPRFEELLADYARVAAAPPLDVILVGDGELDGAIVDRLPAGSSLKRLRPGGFAPRARLVDLGQAPARSGAVDRVDVLVRLALPERTDLTPRGRLDGLDLPAPEVGAEPALFVWRDLPARAQVLDVLLDDRPLGRLLLDDRRPLPYALDEELPAALRAALAADPGLLRDDEHAEVVVRRHGNELGAGLPAFEVDDMAAGGAAFRFRHQDGDDSELILGELVDELGLARLDGAELAARLQRDLGVTVTAGGSRGLTIWTELLDEERGFTRSLEFPVFVARGLRWLAGRREAPARVAVAEPIRLASGPVEPPAPAGPAADVLDDDYLPLRGGRHVDARGQAVEASLLEPVTAAALAELVESDDAGTGGLDLFETLVLLALALLALEWFLVQTSRIP